MTEPRSPTWSLLRLVPNALTLLRVALAGAFPFVPVDWRLAVLGAALLTEFLDGVLARRFGWTSRFGRVLDPIADRCLFAAVAATLLVDHGLTWLQLAALGARDLLVALAALWIAARGQAQVLGKMRPRPAGKLTTALQYAALLSVVLGLGLPDLLLAATLVTGLFAAGQYLTDFRRLRQATPYSP
jgi:phosphatidylglycerophosphate synthase